MARPKKVQAEEPEAAVVESVAPDGVVEERIDGALVAVEQAKQCVEPLTLDVPTEHYSRASDWFRIDLYRWLDEVWLNGMHRGEVLILRAPKE